MLLPNLVGELFRHVIVSCNDFWVKTKRIVGFLFHFWCFIFFVGNMLEYQFIFELTFITI
jgi:hypothetical protein